MPKYKGGKTVQRFGSAFCSCLLEYCNRNIFFSLKPRASDEATPPVYLQSKTFMLLYTKSHTRRFKGDISMQVTNYRFPPLILVLTALLLIAFPASAQTAGTYAAEGDELSDQGKFEDALVKYDLAITMEPKLAFAWCGKGLALYNLTRYDEALDAFDQAIAINPNYAKAQYGRGLVLYELGRYDDAIASYDIALSIYPEYAYLVYYGKAQAYAARGDYSQAIPLFDQALTLQPSKYPGVWVEKGDAMAASGDSQGALAAYQNALALEPGFALAEAGVAAVQGDKSGGVVVTTAIPQATGTPSPQTTTVHTTAPAATRTKAPLSSLTCGAGLLLAAGLALYRRH